MSGQNSNEYGYRLAYKLASEKLAGIDDIKGQCPRSSARYQETGSRKAIIVEYLNRQYKVTLPDVGISVVGSEEEVPVRDRILILHYLTQARGTPVSNRIITYKELPEGSNYLPTFVRRTIKPLLDHFAENPRQLIAAAEELGGFSADYGDAAVTINAFIRVPITLVLWRGDEELPPEGNIIFDASISDYLSTEDINVLCETIAWRLVKSLGAGGEKPDEA